MQVNFSSYSLIKEFSDFFCFADIIDKKFKHSRVKTFIFGSTTETAAARLQKWEVCEFFSKLQFS